MPHPFYSIFGIFFLFRKIRLSQPLGFDWYDRKKENLTSCNPAKIHDNFSCQNLDSPTLQFFCIFFSPNPTAMKKTLLPFLLMLLCIPAFAQSISDYLSAPFPTGLVASPDGNSIAWIFNDKGDFRFGGQHDLQI